MPRLSKIGAAALAAFGWTGGATVTASVLVVAGGGGGGAGTSGVVEGGGGGAGGYRTSTDSLNPTLSYTVTVGAGGTSNTNGSDSIFAATTSTGGGAGGRNGTTSGSTGGSGGGAGGVTVAGANGNTPSTSPSQGNNGGSGIGAPYYASAGGGGAGAVGGTAVTTPGAGGAGTANNITGSSVTYGGGGGGTQGGTTSGAGGAGGGGAGATSGNGNPGTANLGGGGGAGSSVGSGAGGNGGSGVVIISYAGAQQFGGGVVTSVGGNTIHTFTTSGTLGPITTLSASYLVVGGGGGAGQRGGGGGGAGGYQVGSVTIDPNSTYLVTVGAGGAGASASGSGNIGTAGSSSGFLATTSAGGGYGGALVSTTYFAGGAGGSGGGGCAGFSNTGAGAGGAGNTPSTSPAQGSNGGSGINGPGGTASAGGGGGSSAAGQTAPSTGQGGAGGAGTANSISGTSTYYAGGGGGAGNSTGGTGGVGGGGNGTSGTTNGVAGTANTGGGGGGGRNDTDGTSTQGGAGGSGVVIISYAGATQLMAGGTVTISGGNVIHTFTSSGYLTPIKLVNRSLRFRSSASAYLNRTNSTPTSGSTFTVSFWVKRGTLGANQTLMSGTRPGNFDRIYFANTDTLIYQWNDGSSNLLYLETTQLFRDPSAWYHIVVVTNTTQATSSNRAAIYINGVQVTAFSTATYPSQNAISYLNASGVAVNLGRTITGTLYYDGYLTEINFIDGQALTPNSFGTINSYGVWQPITYGGSYGTNGFYLPFTNNASTTTLGYDFSPNGNNWTTNNISLTAGTTYDSMTDVPTLTSATAANYCVSNPLDKYSTTAISSGNLTTLITSGGSSPRPLQRSTFFPSSGKYYWEVTLTAGSTISGFGVANNAALISNALGFNANGWGWYGHSGGPSLYHNNVGTSYGTAWSVGDVGMVALDVDTGKIWFGRNGTWFNSSDPATATSPAFSNVTNNVSPTVADYGSGSTTTFNSNFGQRPFTYTPPSGFVALNTYNL